MDEKIKSTILSLMPNELEYALKLLKNKHNRRLDYAEIEKLTDKNYYAINKRHIDWDDPKTYTEKINFSKIYNDTDIKSKLTDKLGVREWISNVIGNEYLIPIYGVYNNFSDICIKDLPNEFVTKCTHDSGSVKAFSDIDKFTKNDLLNIEREYDHFYLKRNFGYKFFEMQYVDIKPRIIVEKYMGESIKDYKFLCFNGEPYFCWVDIDRFYNHKRNIYDLNWNLQPFNQMTYGNYGGIIEKPREFEKMIDLTRVLSNGFDHVRVDMYYCEDKIYFGEMTFTNGGGFEMITPYEWDIKLGNLWNLDTKMRNVKRNGI